MEPTFQDPIPESWFLSPHAQKISRAVFQGTQRPSPPPSPPTNPRILAKPEGVLPMTASPVDVPTGSSGFSRRNFFRFAAGASALASMPILTEAHLAMAQRPHFADPNKGIHIDANENPLGPCDAARTAMIDIVPRGGRTLMDMEMDLTSAFAKMEGLDPESVMAFAGSSEPLHYTVLTFTDKSKPLVVADPGYEAPMWAAKIAGAEVIKVPLADPKAAASHETKATLAASTTTAGIHL